MVIRKVVNKYVNKFKIRCFHKQEILKSEDRFKIVESYAKRYAAKEAFSKSLGTGVSKGLNFNEIEVRNNVLGRPYLKIKGDRGIIYDRNGVALVDNRQIYDLSIIPFDVTQQFNYNLLSLLTEIPTIKLK